MVIYLNRDTLDSEMLDTTNMGVITENFTYLIKELSKYVNPNYKYKSVNKGAVLKGGARRVVRADRSEGLGYKYKTAASKSTISSRGTKTITAFGQKVLVEEWVVSHPDITDSDLGERYPTQDSNGNPRGPYTCLITARIALQQHKATRCYVQCNCADFKATFYEKLHQQAYTNPLSLPASTGKIPQAPAICKHLYAIYSKYYRDIVRKTESGAVSSPILFGGPAGSAPSAPIAPILKVAKTKQDAITLIKKHLQDRFNVIKSNDDAYFDSRSKKAGGSSYHKYPFYVTVINGYYRILYRNKKYTDQKDNTNSLQIPDNKDIWKFFNKKGDHALLWNMVKDLGEMPEAKQNALQPGRIMFESKSSILSSLSELI